MFSRLLSFDPHSGLQQRNPLWFLLALIILIIFPLIAEFAGKLTLLLLPISYTLLVVSGMYVVANSRRVFRLGLFWGLGLILLVWINYSTGNRLWVNVFQGFSFLVLFCILFIYLGRTVLLRPQIDLFVLYGVTIGYLLIGTIGSTLFSLLDMVRPGSFLKAGELASAGFTLRR